MVAAALPDLDQLDNEALKRLVIERHEQHVDALSSQTQQIEHLKLVIEKYRRMIFGRKSEKAVAQLEQFELQIEELETAQAADAAELTRTEATPSSTETAGQRPSRKPLPDHLPREVVTHHPAQDCCPDCGGALRNFGEDVAEMLEYIPANFKVVRHVRPKFACRQCERVVEAPAPARTIERGLAGPGLLAHVLVAKYADHCPLYRQSEIYAREGVELDRSTLAGWVGATSELLTPLVDALGKHVLSARKIHADDTPVPVLAPGNGKTKTGRLWTYVRDERPAGEVTAPAVWFAYSEDRKGEHPRTHLKNFKGALQADAYAGFHHLYEGGEIYEVACWAHARRKFHDIHVVHASPITTEAINRIGALYGIEEEVRGKPIALRREIRQTRAKPLLDDMRNWMEKSLRQLSAKSETAGAIRYALSHWRALVRYVDDGLLEIDNSAAERALRAVALGRKNYLFCGSNSGGRRAAAIYSLLGSAKLNDIDPEEYLRQVLTRVAEHLVKGIDQLLPWNLANALQPVAKAA
jgi:transposase